MNLKGLKQFRALNSNELKLVTGGISRQEYCKNLNDNIANQTSMTDTEIRSFAKALADHC